LRTNLQFVDIDCPPRSIVVTSSIPDEGKTTTAINLSIVLAQSGVRVLLIEADLRRPKISQYLGVESAVGLTNVLVGRTELHDAVQTWGRSGELKVLPSGPPPPNPSELLGTQGMADLIRELERDYDLVLIDAPPLLPVTDAAVIAGSASGAVMVVRHGHCRRDQLSSAVRSLHAVDATLYGVVLTMTPTKGANSGYYYYGQAHSDSVTEASRGLDETSLQPRRSHSAARHSASPPYPEPASRRPAELRPVGTTMSLLNGNESRQPAASLGEDPLEFFER
jgi:non-specific protein-tyrosine kinase